MDNIVTNIFENRDLWVQTKHWNDFLWVNSSKIILIPNLILLLIKLSQKLKGDFSDISDTKNNRLYTKIGKILHIYAVIYYIVDIICYYFLGKLKNDLCYQGFFVHHLFSLWYLYYFFRPEKKFQWYEAFVATMHASMLTFPTIKAIQGIYLLSIVTTHSFSYLEPYTQIRLVRICRRFCLVAYGFAAYVTYFKCLGMMDAANIQREL